MPRPITITAYSDNEEGSGWDRFTIRFDGVADDEIEVSRDNAGSGGTEYKVEDQELARIILGPDYSQADPEDDEFLIAVTDEIDEAMFEFYTLLGREYNARNVYDLMTQAELAAIEAFNR